MFKITAKRPDGTEISLDVPTDLSDNGRASAVSMFKEIVNETSPRDTQVASPKREAQSQLNGEANASRNPPRTPIVFREGSFYRQGKKPGTVVLNHTPDTIGDANKILLVLLAHRLAYNENDVLVTRLRVGLGKDKDRAFRLDRITVPFVNDGTLLKAGGSGRSGTYALSDKGLSLAKQNAKILGYIEEAN